MEGDGGGMLIGSKRNQNIYGYGSLLHKNSATDVSNVKFHVAFSAHWQISQSPFLLSLTNVKIAMR